MAVLFKQAWKYGLYTHPGTSKADNQDRVLFKVVEIDKIFAGLAVVADGMGGHSAGSLASSVGVDLIAAWWDTLCNNPDTNKMDVPYIKEDLYKTMHDINQHLLEYGRQNDITTGTTMSLLYLYDQNYLIAHVGDSRIYQYNPAPSGKRNKKNMVVEHKDEVTEPLEEKQDNIQAGLHQLTDDHSWVSQLVQKGLLTKEEARLHPKRNLLLNCLGIEEGLKVSFYSGSFQSGDIFLLCSDGYYSLFADEEIASDLQDLLKAGYSFQNMCEHMIGSALQRKAQDNISIILLSPTLLGKKMGLTNVLQKLLRGN